MRVPPGRAPFPDPTHSMRPFRLLPLLAMLVHTPVEGQARPSAEASRVTRADSLLMVAGDAEAAFQLLADPAVAERPSAAVEWRAARAATALAVVHDAEPRERERWLDVALRHARAAVAADSTDLDALYWEIAVKGRMSLHADPRRAVELATAVSEGAHALLARAPDHAGAHNALGRMNLEVMILPGWKRAIARAVAGEALRQTGWEVAERHLTRALELEPGYALFLRDLGALHFHRGREEAARILLRRLVARTGLQPWDEVFRQEAVEMLKDLGGA